MDTQRLAWMRALAGAVVLVGLAACATGQAVYAPPAPDETAAARQARYQTWRAAHRDVDARLRRIARQTATLVAAHPARTNNISAPPEIFRTRDTGMSVWECPVCPEMVVTPAGRYSIGSPETEPGRTRDEGPRKRITLDHALLVGRFEITREQYENFVSTTHYPMRSGCVTGRAVHGVWALDPSANYRDPGYAQTQRHPVACVSWDDARAYIEWLNTRTGGGYRLLSESEWEYVARAGTTTTFPWGADVNEGCRYANGADRRARNEYPDWPTAECDDGTLNTAPVGSYLPNAFGLYDMIGNVADWIEDCYQPSYDALPTDGSPVEMANCAARGDRGNSWGGVPEHMRTADRYRYPPLQLDDSVGIRVARSLARPTGP